MFTIRLAKKEEIQNIKTWSETGLNRKANLAPCFLDGNLIKILIVSMLDAPMGIVIFHPWESEISIFLVPGNHGRKRGKDTLEAAHGWIKRYYPCTAFIFAECVNEYSAKLFDSMGYKQKYKGGSWWKTLS